jgi:hypothetical protein
MARFDCPEYWPLWEIFYVRMPLAGRFLQFRLPFLAKCFQYRPAAFPDPAAEIMFFSGCSSVCTTVNPEFDISNYHTLINHFSYSLKKLLWNYKMP